MDLLKPMWQELRHNKSELRERHGDSAKGMAWHPHSMETCKGTQSRRHERSRRNDSQGTLNTRAQDVVQTRTGACATRGHHMHVASRRSKTRHRNPCKH